MMYIPSDGFMWDTIVDIDDEVVRVWRFLIDADYIEPFVAWCCDKDMIP